ncbi:MAG TPA: peptidylprolyl isomerase [Chondromyces sp.]|nr:peptidylprolyl isomerase [Chondromyces sp.]
MKTTTLILAAAIAAGAAQAAAQSPSTFEARQSYLFEALDRWGADRGPALTMLQDPYPESRVALARVLAANPSTAQLPLLVLYLEDSDPRVREQVMLAAGRLGRPGLELALQGLAAGPPRVRQAAAWAACHAGSEAWEPLSRLLDAERDPAVLETLLANLWRLEGSPWHEAAARFAAGDNPYLRRAAAYSLSRSGAPEARPSLRRLAGDAEPVIRATAVNGLARGELSDDDVTVLAAALADPDWRVRAAACAALAAHDTVVLPAAAVRAAGEALASPHPQLAAAALQAAGRQRSIGTAKELRKLALGDEPWAAGLALAALAAREPEAAAPIAEGWAGSKDLWRRRAAARAAVDLGAPAEARAAADADAGVRLAWLAALEPGQVAPRRAKLEALLGADPDPAVRAQVLSLLGTAEAAPGLDELLAFAAAWRDDAMPDARAEALAAALAAADTDTARESVIAAALADRDPVVGAMLANAARNLGREIELPRREPRHGRKWYAELVEWSAEPRWLDVETDRGAFRIRLDLESAPLSAREIWDLAADGFYDGLDFHRVVPNFVVQGGDPRGDGWGGPGFALPDEPSLQPFDSWRVGIATSGPQTGGCQLFVTLMPADHLTGHYTNLGEVVAGREVLTELRVGDRIREIRTLSGPDTPPLAAPKRSHSALAAPPTGPPPSRADASR